jgi:hypothetical protein
MKKRAEEASTKTARCFLLSEQLAIASNSINEAATKAAKSTRRGSARAVREAVRDAKYALTTAALISDDIGRKAKGIARELTKEEAKASVAYTPSGVRHKRFDDALSKINHDVADLRSKAARQCGVVRYDEPSERSSKLLKKLEMKAVEELPLPSKSEAGYRAFDFKPIIKRRRR